jgi:hypothetical protein
MTTLTQLVATYNELATAAGKPTRKSFESKAKAEAAIAGLQPSTGAKLKVKRVRKTAEVHAKGPRGFKFGPKWLASIAEGKGIALNPINFPKLLDTATFKNVEVTPDLTQAEVAAMVAKAL